MMQPQVHDFIIKHLGAQPDGWPNSTGIFNKWLLIREEYLELSGALGIVARTGEHFPDDFHEVDAVDAICDLLYVIFNLAEELKVNITPFFDEVHRSNMTKTPGALSPTKKIQKGPDFQPPRITEMLKAHRDAGSPRNVARPADAGVTLSLSQARLLELLLMSHLQTWQDTRDNPNTSTKTREQASTFHDIAVMLLVVLR